MVKLNEKQVMEVLKQVRHYGLGLDLTGSLTEPKLKLTDPELGDKVLLVGNLEDLAAFMKGVDFTYQKVAATIAAQEMSHRVRTGEITLN